MVQLTNVSIYKPSNIYLFTVNNKNIRKRKKARNMFSVKN